MNCTALLVLLLLMVTLCSSTESECTTIKPNTRHHLHFRHVSDLAISSVAPWTWRTDTAANRDPENILNAECKNCTVPGMVAKPISFRVHVYIRDNRNTYKSCPYEVAVGCTCVREQQQ